MYQTSNLVADEVGRWLGERRLLLVTDFDGTLSELAPTPGEAVLSPEVRETLRLVSSHPRTTLAVMSGRRIDDVKRRTLDLARFVGGLHGLEIAGPSGGFLHPALPRAQPIIADIVARARAALTWCPNVVVEDKTYAVTCHVRKASLDDAARALAKFVEIAQPALDADVLRVLPAAQALELLPLVDWHKGRAIDWIRSVVGAGPHGDVGVVCLGDDRTDEDGFAAIQDQGIAIGVGDRPHDHLIRFRLAGPASVGRFLDRLHTDLS